MTLSTPKLFSSKPLLISACLAVPITQTQENILETRKQYDLIHEQYEHKERGNNEDTLALDLSFDTLATPKTINFSHPNLDDAFSPTTKHLFRHLIHIHDTTWLFIECDRKKAYDALCITYPKAKHHKHLLEKSYFLYEGWYIYLELEEKIQELLCLTHSEHVWTYAWFMRHSRELSRQKTETHVYITQEYIDYLITKRSESWETKAQIQKLFSPIPPPSPTESFARTDQEHVRHDTLKLIQQGKKDTITFFSTHLPHQDANKSLDTLWYIVVSSKIWKDDWSCDSPTRTCTHGLQPIVITWLKQLEQILTERYQVSMDHKIIRWWTERGHFFGTQKKWLIAWQIDPSYKKHIHIHPQNNISTGAVKKPWLILTTHGYGNTIDLSIGSPQRVRAMEELLSTWTSLWLWYKLTSLWWQDGDEEIYMISINHGEDISYHYHLWFASKTQLIQANLLPKETQEHGDQAHTISK